MRMGGWNGRGMGNGPAVRGLLALQKKEDPDILFLSETKFDKKGIEKLRYALRMPSVVFVESVGKSGGLALFWKHGINLSLRSMGRMHIDVDIIESDGFKWRFTGIYGEPRAEKREEMWSLLRTLHLQEKLPWVCMGDFNEILYSFEKQSGRPKPQSQMEKFRNALNFCNLNDLGFEGDVFTWRNNNYRIDGYIRERLDRAVANPEWCARFPNYRVVNGCPEHSDHRPVILTIDETYKRCNPRPNLLNKRFEARWLLEEDCENVVNSAWEDANSRGASNTMQYLKSVSKYLHTWSRDVLGDLQQRIKKLRVELEGVRREDISEANIRKEQVIRFKLERLEDQLDVFWRQRAHVHWLEKGDRNTAYFHAQATERKRKNTIISSKEMMVCWWKGKRA
jgi:exonuclease III